MLCNIDICSATKFQHIQGIPLKFEQTLGGSTAQTVYARETCETSKDGQDIQVSEAKRILKIEVIVFEQFQFPQTSLKTSARPIFERKLL